MKRTVAGLALLLLAQVDHAAIAQTAPPAKPATRGQQAVDIYCWDGAKIALCVSPGAGSTGFDYSANAASVPINGYVLLATIPATASRAFVEVQNQSAGTLQLVRDDGAGANQTSILIASGGSAGVQGGGWSSATFKGRIRVYGATGAQAAAYQE